MRIGVNIEIDSAGAAAGHAELLPGCFSFGQDEAEALARMPAAIMEFVSWLRRHGEPPPISLPDSGYPEVEVRETVRAQQIPGSPGNRATLFSSDRGYLSDQELARAMRRLHYSREDLLGLALDLDEARHGEKSGVEAGDWTIPRILRHIADSEYGYARRVAGPWLDPDGQVDDERPAGIFERLRSIRAIFTSRLGAMPIAERDRVILPSWANRPDEPWTLKKVLRRALEHEREHTLQVSALLYQAAQERGPMVGG